MEKPANPSPGLEIRQNGRRLVFLRKQMPSGDLENAWYEPALSASEMQYRADLAARTLNAAVDAVVSDLTPKNIQKLEFFASNAVVRLITVTEAASPPKGAAGLVAFFAPVKVREQLLGDLEEAYFDNVERIGPRAAKWSYRYQVAAAAVAFAGPRLLAWSGVAALIKRFGAG